MKKCIVLRLVVMLLLSFFSTANATVWYVHPDSTLNSIQAGIDSCSTNDTVLVGAGTYVENINWPNIQGIVLISESGPEMTIIDGVGTDIVIGLYYTGIDTTTIINGFTIRNGSDAGIECDFSSPTITGNIIKENTGSYSGGGIVCGNSSPFITGNTITENTANWGGGIYCGGSSAKIAGNTISENISYYHGGGIYCGGSAPKIIDNTITGNTANENGGGIWCAMSSPTIADNTITENTGNLGGGIHCSSSSLTIDSCTISNNNGDGVYCVYSSSAEIHYNDIFGNTGYGVINSDSTIIVNAKNNWWGDLTGPYHPDSNPGGLGDSVSNYVDFIPWLTEAGVEEESDIEFFSISQCYPNPFMDRTQIEYNLPTISNVNIAVYNVLGARMKILLNNRQNPGIYTITWDGRDERGNKLPSGFYFLNFKAGDYKGTRKLLLIR
jgi:parallel beta-helix repeat protein